MRHPLSFSWSFPPGMLLASVVLALAGGVALERRVSRHVCVEQPGLVVDAPVVEAPLGEVSAESASDAVELVLAVEPSTDGCRFYSVWDVQPVVVERDVTEASFQRTFDFVDGCTWTSHETIESVAPGRFRYTYTEAPISCRPHARAALACTRSGFAVVSE